MSSNQRNSGNGRNLPRPNVAVPREDTPGHEWTPQEVKGVLMNPIYAGMGPYPPMVTDAEWIAACEKILAEDGAEQFLVNLLHVLRESIPS